MRRSRDAWTPGTLVIANLKSGTTLRGRLRVASDELIVLEHVELLSPAPTPSGEQSATKLDGDVIIHLDNLDFAQLP